MFVPGPKRQYTRMRPRFMKVNPPNFPRNIDNLCRCRYTSSIYDRERKAMSDEESDSTGDQNPNRMTGCFLKHIICLC